MNYLHPVAFIPNDLITDSSLHFTTKRIAAVLLFLSGRKSRAIRVTYRQLAKIAGCSTTTAQQAIGELVQHGYLAKQQNYHFSAVHGHLIRSSNSYIWLRRTGGYTMVRREILSYQLSPAGFASLLYLYRCAGQTGRAFPSIRRIAGRLKSSVRFSLDMAKSTVCQCIQALRSAQAVIRRRCRKVNHAFACNSYFLTNPVRSNGGSPKIDTPSIINQITGAYTIKEEEKGVGQFGRMPNFCAGFDRSGDSLSHVQGLRVSPGDEHELLA